MTSRRALWGLIAASTLLRLIWAASLGLGNDEAYHYLFAVNPDWSYFDHPPMLALIERIGIALAGGVVSPFTLRLGFILLFAGSTWLMARLTARFYGPRAGWLAAFGLNVTAYYTAAAGVFALPDGPLLFFWLLTLDRLAAAIDSPGRLRPWVWVGLAWGGALLSKYHAIFLPMGMLLYILIEPAARGWLRRLGPYLAVAIGLLLFAPVIWWNATHEWASFAFQGGRAMGGLRFRPLTLAGAILGSALYLFPWIWARLVAALVGEGRAILTNRETSPGGRFLLSQAIVPLAIFTAVACTRPVLPHWILVGFLSLFPLLGRAWAARWERDAGSFRRQLIVLAVVPVAIMLLIVAQYRTGFLQQGRPGGIGLVKVSRDLMIDLYGWDQVAEELKRRGLLDQPGTFLFTGTWYHSGHLAFAVRNSPVPVLCYNAIDARSFAFWSKPDQWVGHDGILVAINDRPAEPGYYARWFSRIEPIGAFDVVRAGSPIRKVRLFRCARQTTAFPFDHRPLEAKRALAADNRPRERTRR